MMNIGLFETCRGKFNWNKLTKKKVCILLVSLTYMYHDARFRICKNFKKKFLCIYIIFWESFLMYAKVTKSIKLIISLSIL
jgi:hypothetical protein